MSLFFRPAEAKKKAELQYLTEPTEVSHAKAIVIASSSCFHITHHLPCVQLGYIFDVVLTGVQGIAR